MSVTITRFGYGLSIGWHSRDYENVGIQKLAEVLTDAISDDRQAIAGLISAHNDLALQFTRHERLLDDQD